MEDEIAGLRVSQIRKRQDRPVEPAVSVESTIAKCYSPVPYASTFAIRFTVDGGGLGHLGKKKAT